MILIDYDFIIKETQLLLIMTQGNFMNLFL